MLQKYRIMEIKCYKDSQYGDIVVVWANPAEEPYKGCVSFTPYVCDDTVIFLFPEVEKLVNPILRTANAELIWTINSDDFKEERIVNPETGNREMAYCHMAFFRLDYVS